jgi:hypothetical protein
VACCPDTMKTTSAALGFRLHTGWAAVVAWAGPPREPRLLDRRRIELLDPHDEGGRFVYHRAQELPRARAETLIAKTRANAEAHARAALREVLAAVSAQGLAAETAVVAVGASRLPDDLDKILASHTLVHSAEGALYRGAVVAAAEARGLKVHEVPAKELEARAASALGVAPAKIPARLAATGKLVGRPWSADQKEATLLAWIALG